MSLKVFIETHALVALLSNEPDAQRISDTLLRAKKRYTSPLVIIETALALAQPDKFNLTLSVTEAMVLEFIDDRFIEILEYPPAKRTVRTALHAYEKFPNARHEADLTEIMHYTMAKYWRAAMLTVGDRYTLTDIEIA